MRWNKLLSALKVEHIFGLNGITILLQSHTIAQLYQTRHIAGNFGPWVAGRKSTEYLGKVGMESRVLSTGECYFPTHKLSLQCSDSQDLPFWQFLWIYAPRALALFAHPSYTILLCQSIAFTRKGLLHRCNRSISFPYLSEKKTIITDKHIQIHHLRNACTSTLTCSCSILLSVVPFLGSMTLNSGRLLRKYVTTQGTKKLENNNNF